MAQSHQTVSYIKSVIGSCFAVSYFFGSFSTVPLIIGALIVYLGMTEASAGLVMTAEQLAFGLTLMFFAPFVGRFPRRKTIMVVLLLSLPLNIAAMYLDNIYFLGFTRMLTGIAAGIGVAQVYTIASESHDPVRYLGFLAVASTLAGFLLLLMTQETVALMGAAGAFFPLAIAAGLALVFSILIQDHDVISNTSEETPELKVGLMPIALLSIGIFIMALSEAACFAFVERLGASLGISAEDIGLILSTSFLTGLAGSIVATIVGNRYGVLGPCLFGISLLALCIMLVGLSDNTVMLVASLNGLQFGLFFYLPYAFGMGAPWDDQGRIAAFAPSFNFIGLGVGPGLGGYLVQSYGYTSMSYFAVLAFLIAAPSFWLAARLTQHINGAQDAETQL